jgi:hypothetical protein
VYDAAAVLLGVVGATLLGANTWLLVRGVWKPTAKHVSGIPFLGGLALALALALVPALRIVCWVPVVVDPCGLVAFAYAMARHRLDR